MSWSGSSLISILHKYDYNFTHSDVVERLFVISILHKYDYNK